MAVINAASLQALRTSVKNDFQNGLDNVEPKYMQIATVISSSTKSNSYGWIGAISGFREWIGDRQVNSFKEHSYSITNKTFENTIGINRDDFEDDNLGIYRPVVQMVAQEGAEFPDEKVFGLLNSGFTQLCYDGQNFFDTDHPVNSKHDGSGDDESVANMKTVTGYTGKPWFLLDTTRPLKPMIFQERRKLELHTKFNPTDEAVWRSNTFEFGADLRCNAGFGFWQMAFAVKGPLNYANLWAAYEGLKAMKRDGGKKLRIRPNLLVVPPELEKDALKLLNREQIDDGGTTVSNELKGKFTLLVADQL